jgi:hypothetical protein
MSEHGGGFAHPGRPDSVPGSVLLVTAGLVVLVIIYFLLLALLDPGSILRRDADGERG